MPKTARILVAWSLVSLTLLVAGCSAQEKTKPRERITTVTVATVANKDLPITETAVGAETALGEALDYDPTRLRTGAFYVRLPFPESVALRLKAGQQVVLWSFAQPERRATGKIQEIRPALNATSLSRDVIVSVSNPDWRPVGSIRGEVTLGVRRNARVVPEHAVVLRPAGTAVVSVVYIVDGELAKQRTVRTGIMRDGLIEIIDGIQANETVVVDGAALLTNDAKIKVREGQS